MKFIFILIILMLSPMTYANIGHVANFNPIGEGQIVLVNKNNAMSMKRYQEILNHVRWFDANFNLRITRPVTVVLTNYPGPDATSYAATHCTDNKVCNIYIYPLAQRLKTKGDFLSVLIHEFVHVELSHHGYTALTPCISAFHEAVALMAEIQNHKMLKQSDFMLKNVLETYPIERENVKRYCIGGMLEKYDELYTIEELRKKFVD